MNSILIKKLIDWANEHNTVAHYDQPSDKVIVYGCGVNTETNEVIELVDYVGSFEELNEVLGY